jgi:phospholipid/cholesterol/gamma-HCH transport system permease protein
MNLTLPKSWSKPVAAAGDQALFMGAFFRNVLRRGFEWNEAIRQCFIIGYKSLGLVGITGFILGFVLTLQSEHTMK